MKKALRIVLIVFGSIVCLAAINFAPLVSRKSPGMREYVVENIPVIAVPEDRPEAERIAARIASQSARITDALGSEVADGISVIIYPDRKVLHRKTAGLAGMLLPDWFIGRNTTRFVLIASPAHPGPAHSRESIERAAVHEYVHLMTDRRNRALGYWLKEGVALYLAGQVPEPESVRSHSDITWAEYSNPNALQFAEVGGYSLAYTLVDYISRTYGWDSFLALIEPGATSALVLGVPERELFEEWRSTLG